MSDLLTEISTPKEKLKVLPVLTEEQKNKIIETWNSRRENPPSIAELIMSVFGYKEDGRSFEGKAIKEFLSLKSIKATVPYPVGKKTPIILTDEQKEYIANNCIRERAVEMARVLFKNDKLENLSLETRTIADFLKTLNDKIKYADPNSVPAEDYKPPNRLDTAFARIKRYTACEWDVNKLTPSQKKCIHSLIGYMNVVHFTHQMNSYQTQEDRELFESSFVRYCYDKNDLTEEDVDLYIILSTEGVMAANIQMMINRLQEEQNRNIEEGQPLRMNLVESVKNTREEYNQCIKRSQSLFKARTTERAKRLEDKTRDTSSVLNLVSMWKEDETRKKMILMAEKRKEKLGEAVDELASMEDVIARVMGIDKDEVLNG